MLVGNSQAVIERDRLDAERRDRRKKVLEAVDAHIVSSGKDMSNSPRLSIAHSLRALALIARMHERDDD